MKTTKTQNKLIPLSVCATTEGEYEPALIPHDYKFRKLVQAPQGGRYTSGDHQGFDWVPQLDGKVRKQTGPIIRLDDGGLYMIQNPDDFLVACQP